MNEISSGDTAEAMEMALSAPEFADELSDEAMDRPLQGAMCQGCMVCQFTDAACRADGIGPAWR